MLSQIPRIIAIILRRQQKAGLNEADAIWCIDTALLYVVYADSAGQVAVS